LKITSVSTSIFGKPKAIRTNEGFFGKTYDIKDIVSMIPISTESGRSMGGAVTGAVVGGLILGPVAAIAGGLLGAGKSSVAVQVTLRSNRKFMAEINTKDLVKCASSLCQ
jgi:hypothetical protein